MTMLSEKELWRMLKNIVSLTVIFETCVRLVVINKKMEQQELKQPSKVTKLLLLYFVIIIHLCVFELCKLHIIKNLGNYISISSGTCTSRGYFILESKDECSHASQHLGLEDTKADEYEYNRLNKFECGVKSGCVYTQNIRWKPDMPRLSWHYLRWYSSDELSHQSGSCGDRDSRYPGGTCDCICRKCNVPVPWVN